MDESETVAKSYLDRLELGFVEYEPDGNVPPDFLVNRRIAVEVRRLNQNYGPVGQHEGLEELDIRLASSMRKLLSEFGPSPVGQSCYVAYDFSRPLDWRKIRPRVRQALADIHRTMPSHWKRVRIDSNFALDLFPASAPTAAAFILAGSSDDDASGFVEAKLVDNLQICIDDKTQKVAKYVNRYPEWWLILVDRTHLAPDADDVAYAREKVSIPHLWRRIVIIDLARPSKILDVR